MTDLVTRVWVPEYGGPHVLSVQQRSIRPPRRGLVRVRVHYASVGSTDIAARNGRYLFEPTAGFVPGYDFVGTVESVPDHSVGQRLGVGDRVAGCLPRMGSNISILDVPARSLVVIPEGLSDADAATLPLDAVTAAQSLRLAGVGAGSRVLVQGVTGAVGSIAARLAIQRGACVYGTASTRNAAEAAALGVTWLDYADPEWMLSLRDEVPTGLDAIIDHTGDPGLRALASPRGTIVHTAFVRRSGTERLDTARGAAADVLRWWGRPRARICSIPVLVATRPAQFRDLLATQLAAAARGELPVPTPVIFGMSDVRAAHEQAEQSDSGTKVVLRVD